MTEAEPSLAAAGLDFDVASRCLTERQLPAICAELLIVDQLLRLHQLADDAASGQGWAERSRLTLAYEAELWRL